MYIYYIYNLKSKLLQTHSRYSCKEVPRTSVLKSITVLGFDLINVLLLFHFVILTRSEAFRYSLSIV